MKNDDGMVLMVPSPSNLSGQMEDGRKKLDEVITEIVPMKQGNGNG